VGISAKQFEAMRGRLAGRPGKTGSADSPAAPRRQMAAVILGVDPSLRGTGYGVIRWERPWPRALDHGTIKAPISWEHSRCLVQIVQSLRRILQEHRPEVCVIEGWFHAQNLRTALTMGEARGAALAAVAEAGLPIYEIAPRKMKQAIVGYGAAQKDAVARMVQRMLRLQALPEPDAADALALALAHAHEFSHARLSSPKPI